MNLLTKTVTFFFFSVAPSNADFWSELRDTSIAPITVPTEIIIDTLKGNNPLGSVNRSTEAAGKLVSRTEREARRVQDQFLAEARRNIGKAMGKDWVAAFDFLTASYRVVNEMALTAGRYLGSCLKDGACNPERLAALPLAAALRDAHRLYISYSVPLDEGWQKTFSVTVPRSVLSVVRVTVGKTPNITVPGFLNYVHSLNGGGHAVTIGDLIIFSREPNLYDCDDLWWFLHELQHVAQYRSYSGSVPESIDGFAVDYVLNYKGLERDADNIADRWISELDRHYGLNCN